MEEAKVDEGRPGVVTKMQLLEKLVLGFLRARTAILHRNYWKIIEFLQTLL